MVATNLWHGGAASIDAATGTRAKHGGCAIASLAAPAASAVAFASLVKALVLFWIIDETLSANLVYQSDYEIGSTIPSNEAMTKIMTMVMAW